MAAGCSVRLANCDSIESPEVQRDPIMATGKPEVNEGDLNSFPDAEVGPE
jgi:hypothetical protein